MEDKLISFETSKFAKEKGFGKWSGDIKTNWYCQAKYFHKKPRGYNIQNFDEKTPLYISGYDNWVNEYPFCNIWTYAPTQSLLQRWLREVHKIHISPMFIGPDTNKYQYRIDIEGSGNTGEYSKWFLSFEECFEEGLKEGLNLIK